MHSRSDNSVHEFQPIGLAEVAVSFVISSIIIPIVITIQKGAGM